MRNWSYVVIFTDGTQTRGYVSASSYSNAYALVQRIVQQSSNNRKGVAEIIVDEA
ncbi:MAG: hypothetical protein IKS42_01185 [Oscillospiraceae bacterium]|nr:hypothetical protein [Oscillospiraceae bacterium]